MPGWKSVEGLFQDLRYATRQLGRNPGFAIVAVLSLALGIGANTAIFGLIDHVMLRFLPVRNPEELLVVRGLFSYPRFEQIRDRNEVFSGGFIYYPDNPKRVWSIDQIGKAIDQLTALMSRTTPIQPREAIDALADGLEAIRQADDGFRAALDDTQRKQLAADGFDITSQIDPSIFFTRMLAFAAAYHGSDHDGE